ncbi:MAG: nucleoside kinase, partial [Anaerolineales bacterium]
MAKSAPFLIVKPRNTVEIYLPDGKTIRGPRNAALKDFLQVLQQPDLPPIVGAIVNGELRELTYPIKIDSRVQPITMADTDGMRIYRRSLTLLLETAFQQLYPNAYLTVDHSVSSGGYYCQVGGRAPLSETELFRLEARMKELVAADLPLVRQEISIEEARAYFASIGADDMVRLLAYRQKPYVTVYELDGFRDYHHGYMVPSTGYLKWFALTPTDHGFTLRFPRKHAPTQLLPLPSYPKLLAAFRQYG